MEQQKYIRVKSVCNEQDVFVLFPHLINHADMARYMGLTEDDIVSAGFVQNIVVDGDRQANCHGKSVSLKCASLPEDTQILEKQHYSARKKQKYVRLDMPAHDKHTIVLFPETVIHADFVERFRGSIYGPVTAGFVSNSVEERNLSPRCYGESESLGLESVEEDTDLLIRQHYSFLIPDLW